MNKHRLLLTLLPYARISCVLSYIRGSFPYLKASYKNILNQAFFQNKTSASLSTDALSNTQTIRSLHIGVQTKRNNQGRNLLLSRSGRIRVGFDTSYLTHIKPTHTRFDVGALLKRNIAQFFQKSSNFIKYFRG